MKNLLETILFLAVLCLAGCQPTAVDDTAHEPVCIRFGGFEIDVVRSSRASLSDACTVLDYYRYTDGVLTGSKQMKAGDDDFGSFTDTMPWGTHKLYFIGHRSEVTDFTDGIASFDKVSDTFTHCMTLTVDQDTDTGQTITLVRRVAKFELLVKDALPDNLASMDFRITGGSMSVDVETGFGGAVVEQSKTINVPASVLGSSENTFSSYIFLPEDVTEVDIAVTAKDADGNKIVECDFEDVEVKANVITRYKGMMFGLNVAFNVSVDDEWDDAVESEF